MRSVEVSGRASSGICLRSLPEKSACLSCVHLSTSQVCDLLSRSVSVFYSEELYVLYIYNFYSFELILELDFSDWKGPSRKLSQILFCS